MAVEKPMLSHKQLKQLIRELKEQQPGLVDYSKEGHFFKEVMGKIGDDPIFILQEIVSKALKEVVDEDAKFNFSSKQIDLIGYGEKWIKLPESQTIKVRKASLDHLRVQQQMILDEHIKAMQAYIIHNNKILVPLIKTMEQHQLETAGEAIDWLLKISS